MQGLLLSLAMALGAAPGEAWPSGTLIFLENCNSVVEFSTGDEIGHVALVFPEGKKIWIYEATPGKVRRVTWSEYEVELARINARRKADDQMRVLALIPQKAYTLQETAAMRKFLDDQIGRRYSVKNYVRDKPGDGIHCAELASTTLTRSGRYDFSDFHAIHPAALFALVQPTYEPAQTLELPAWESDETWCQRADRRWGEIWAWCRWSGREMVSLCW